eukprot:scaffold36287_cov21-Tisochrysis_lutea.AAC.1
MVGTNKAAVPGRTAVLSVAMRSVLCTRPCTEPRHMPWQPYPALRVMVDPSGKCGMYGVYKYHWQPLSSTFVQNWHLTMHRLTSHRLTTHRLACMRRGLPRLGHIDTCVPHRSPPALM